MTTTSSHTSVVQNTSHKVVLPFYAYAALSFLAATVLLFFSTSAFTQHYFHPQTLAVTHTMALGWGTMMIFGAGYQLFPVLIEARLYSNRLAGFTFVLAGAGIPLLVYAFLTFQFDWPAMAGAILVNAAVLCFFINLTISFARSKSQNVHALFVLTSVFWLFLTTLVGLVLVLNFTRTILANDSLHYLSLHAHLGIVGWFLLLVMGVGSRLLPMFLISKYDQPKTLWQIYYLVNGSLLLFVVLFVISHSVLLFALPVLLLFASILLFVCYCRNTYRQRLRRQVDEAVKISLLSVAMMGLPLLMLAILLVALLTAAKDARLVLAYGFSVFFGWLTAIILGMTFKTLPFIVWNKVYFPLASTGKTPNPKDLFSLRLFNSMGVVYLLGFVLFLVGIFTANHLLLQLATVLLVTTSVLYNVNTAKLLLHKPTVS